METLKPRRADAAGLVGDSQETVFLEVSALPHRHRARSKAPHSHELRRPQCEVQLRPVRPLAPQHRDAPV